VSKPAKRSSNPRFAADSTVAHPDVGAWYGHREHAFDEVFDSKKKQKKAKLDTDLDVKL